MSILAACQIHVAVFRLAETPGVFCKVKIENAGNRSLKKRFSRFGREDILKWKFFAANLREFSRKV
jgi:hypothetical protein